MEPRQPDDESHGDTAVLAGQIFDTFRERLEAENSVLMQSPDTVRQLRRQVASIVTEVLGRSDPPATPDSPEEVADDLGEPVAETPLAVQIGASRALRGVHPVESLRAASALFDAALPVLVGPGGRPDGTDPLVLSAALHRAVMDRVALASLAYVSFLMEKLQASRQEECRRIARELHDRVGHGMGLALQHLDLHRLYAAQDPDRAEVKLAAAVASLGEALRTVQQLSAELRRSVGADGIERALRAYLRANVPATVQATFQVTGDAKLLPSDVSEELYLILREAVRNALRHAAPTRITIDLEVTDLLVRATVVDDGRGFEPGNVAFSQGGGLPSMGERADLLRGQLDLHSRLGQGTRIGVQVPLRGERL
ncbi:sensor histidine kinase [Plantactinospora sp. WMMB782]|uniref:sensor histidine kinase n=1 Tax=Plantactinospora sp. WMMB782 TaxID=3404121 RepID=UPI003B9380EF